MVYPTVVVAQSTITPATMHASVRTFMTTIAYFY
jgi:hypothetical protein